MAALLRDGGLQTNGLEARRVPERMLKEADLILAMTRAERGMVVELWPPGVRRAFTLRKFARLLDQADASVVPASCRGERLQAAIPLVTAERGRRPASPDDDDVVDPFGPSNEVYAQSFAQITSAVESSSKTSASYFDLKKWRHIAALRRSRARRHRR